jgi:IS5 family transposase
MKTFKAKEAPGFFDVDLRMQWLKQKGDPLNRLNQVIDWEIFHPILESVLGVEAKAPGGRPPFEWLMMFKILVVQRFWALSDEQVEFWINDRLSFQRFLGLTLADKVPDGNTIWDFREKLVKADAIEKLFARFKEELAKKGMTAHEGKVVDATFVDVPKQRNSREENAKIKAGEVPEKWKDQPHKLSQKDVDARWTKKNQETHFGYKDHVKVNAKSKLIEEWKVTEASVHDSQAEGDLTKKGDGKMYGDSAYRSEDIEKDLAGKEIESQIHERAYRGQALTEEQEESNRRKSKIRARIEHVFGYMTQSMGGLYLEYIGKLRNTAAIGLINLIYNLARYEQIVRLKLLEPNVAGAG